MLCMKCKDANLWRSQIWSFFFQISNPPTPDQIHQCNPPPKKKKFFLIGGGLFKSKNFFFDLILNTHPIRLLLI